MKKFSLFTILLICSLNKYAFSQLSVYGAMGADKIVPNWPIAECGGSKENLHSYLDAGKVVMVYYADTWCGICKDKASETFTSPIIKALLNKYPNKIQFLAAFDGPTDCNGVDGAKRDYGWGSEIKGFVDNSDDKSKFYTWGAPGFIMIDPKTKKAIYSTYNGSDPREGLEVLELYLNGKFVYPNAVSNIAYRKKITSLYPQNENIYQPLGCVNDGILGSTFNPDDWTSSGFIIDFGAEAQVTGFRSYFQESNGPESYTVSLSNNEKGPWNKITGNFGSKGVNEISKINYTGRYIKWESSSKGPFSEFTVQGKLLGPTGSENAEVSKSITISPNPSNGLFSINIDNYELDNAKVIISDVSGKQAAILNLVAGNNNYDLSFLDNGVYFANIYLADSYVKTSKLVIQK